MFDIKTTEKGAMSMSSGQAVPAVAPGAPPVVQPGVPQAGFDQPQVGFNQQGVPGQALGFNQAGIPGQAPMPGVVGTDPSMGMGTAGIPSTPPGGFNQGSSLGQGSGLPGFNQMPQPQQAPAYQQPVQAPQQGYGQQAPVYQQPAPVQPGYVQPAQVLPQQGSGLKKSLGNRTALTKELVCGERFSLTQQGIDAVRIGLSWDPMPGQVNGPDLDLSVFVLGTDEKELSGDYMVFYGNKRSPEGAVTFDKDSRNGVGAGDDESIKVSLKALPPQAVKVACIASVYYEGPKLTLAMAANPRFHVVDDITGNEICALDILNPTTAGAINTFSSMICAELVNKNGEWKVRAVGRGFVDDLAGICRMYGDARGM